VRAATTTFEAAETTARRRQTEDRVSLRIAFDLDGTLADLHAALEHAAGAEEQQLPVPGGTGDEPGGQPEVSPEEARLEPPALQSLSGRRQRQIWDSVLATENFWEGLDEIEPGIVARIAALADERGWEVIFLTQRPACEGDTTQRQTQRWLGRFGFELPSVFVLGPTASRGKVASALGLDVVVDDRTENCLDVKADSSARAFLVARRGSPELPRNASRLGIEAVGTTGECLDILAAGTAVRPGWFGRLRRALGGGEERR
jgi:hypothetical protein